MAVASAKKDTTAKPTKGAASDQMRLDDASKLMLYTGASISQLAILFRQNKGTVSQKIAGVQPCGFRAGFPIYAVYDVAPYLVKPVGDFEEAIKRMHHDDIPSLLHKNYWQGKREKMKFEEEQGLLINVYEAAELIAKAFKALRMTIMLMPDAIEREHVLTDDHRSALKRLVDGFLSEARTNLIDAFPTPEQPQETNDDGPDDGDVFDAVTPDGEAGDEAPAEDEYGGL